MRERSINAIIKNSAFRCVVSGERMLAPTRAVPCFSPQKKLERDPRFPRRPELWQEGPRDVCGCRGARGAPTEDSVGHVPSFGEGTGSHDGVGGVGFYFFCRSRLALPYLGVSCFSYIVAWESCVTVKRVTISLSELLPSRCRVLESSQQTSTADTLPTRSFSRPSACTY